MKILFVSDYLLAPYGGAQKSAIAHLESLRLIVGKSAVDVAAINYSSSESSSEYILLPYSNGHIQTLINELHGNVSFISRKLNKIVFNLVDTQNYDIIFLDNSWFGKIAKYVKKNHPKIRILTNFHGVKFNSRLQNIRNNPFNLLVYTDFLLSVLNEKKIIRYSDKLLLLNSREDHMLRKYYNHKADLLLPVYFVDTAKINTAENDSLFHILFVGGALPANIKGIKWFIENVLPLLQGEYVLDIVGNSMEKLMEESNLNDRVHVIGKVASLDFYYNSANLVIGPIFEGDGMKTKTAEALMYGKYFLGTDEALCGYEELKAYRCNSAKEFSTRINKMIENHTPKFSYEMRLLFKKKYSMQMADSIFRKALEV